MARIAGRAIAHDTRVTFRPDMRPSAWPYANEGVVFTSGARLTFVVWDGQPRPMAMATVALKIVKA